MFITRKVGDLMEGQNGTQLFEMREFPVVSVDLPNVENVNVPLFKDRIALAAVYVDMALTGRCFGLCVDDVKSWKAVTKSYWAYHNAVVGRYAMLALLMVVGFFQRSGWCWALHTCAFTTVAGGIVRVPLSTLPILSNNVSLVIELVALLGWFLTDPALKFFFLTRTSWFFRTAESIKTILFVVSVVDILVSFAVPQRSWRLSPWLRPCILSVGTVAVRHAMLRFAHALWRVADVLLVILGYLLIFAWIGLIVWHGTDGGTTWDSYGSALREMQVCFTTANFPDVMMPAYALSQWAILFYVAFFLLGLFHLLPLTLGSIFVAYKEDLSKEAASFHTNQRQMLLVAFYLMSRAEKKTVEFPDLEALFDELNWYSFIPYVTLAKRQLMLQYLDQSRSGFVSQGEFMRILSALTSKIQHTAYVSPLHRCFPNWKPGACFDRVSHFVSGIGLRVCVDIVVLVDVGLTVYQTLVLLGSTTDRSLNWSTWVNFAFVLLYVCEMLVKLLIMGPAGYWAVLSNRFDAVITVGGFCVSLVVVIPNDVNDPLLGRIFTLFRMLRFFRIISRVPRVQIFTTMYARLLPLVGLALLPLVILMYLFALIGDACFGGLLYPGNAVLNGTLYAAASPPPTYYYFYLNFNDLWSSCVTLFCLLIVNNWFIIASGPEAVTSSWARIYFVCWWLLVVLVVINVFVAITLEAITVARKLLPDQQQQQQDDEVVDSLRHVRRVQLHDLVEEEEEEQ